MKKIWNKRLGYGLALGLAAAGLAGCATDAVTGKSVANFYSIEDDVALGRAALEANTEAMEEAGVPINRDRVRLVKLQYMVERIAAVSHMPELPYTVTLYQTNIVNAAAAPGGSLMIFEGLYDPKEGLAHTEDEIAAVIAHEIAHITCRHTTKRLSKTQSANLIAEVAGAFASAYGYGTAGDVIRSGFMVAGALWLPAYSRADEAEADRVGLMYMARAGYDPRAALNIWDRAMEKGESMGENSLFSTHPSHANRHANLEKMMPAALRAYEEALAGRTGTAGPATKNPRPTTSAPRPKAPRGSASAR